MLHRRNPERDLQTPDGSRISELLGRVTTQNEQISVARIVMPANQGQPLRQNRFHEVLIVIEGTCEVELSYETVQLGPDDVLELPPLTPYAERGGPGGCTAWAICTPAFSPVLVEWLT